MKVWRSYVLVSLVSLGALALAQGDPAVVDRVIHEGKTGNQVMEHLTYLCTQFGARLTGSPSLQKACEWARAKFEEYGLQNCRLEQWGEVPVGFQRGKRQMGRMVAPVEREFQFTTRSWTAGTNGPVRAPAVMEPTDLASLALKRSQLRGAWVIVAPAPPRGQDDPNREIREKINAELDAIGIAGRVSASRNELVITSGSFRNLTFDNLPKGVTVIVRKSDRDAIIEQIARGHRVELEFDLENQFIPGPIPVYNVVAEIRGTEKPDEVVIVGGHLDSWDGPGSQGTCDNGTGTMVALEAARLLMKAGAKPKRTIRFVLFTGEEQGLLGSRAYVEKHKDEMGKISAVFIDDGGTNYSGGLVCLESMVPMLAEATRAVNEAFPEMPIQLRVVPQMPRGGGSDHVPFNAIGVPGFFWTETGRADYNFIHHTQHDHLEHAIPEYLVQSSVASAVTAYNLACAETLLPRQPAGAENLLAIVR